MLDKLSSEPRRRTAPDLVRVLSDSAYRGEPGTASSRLAMFQQRPDFQKGASAIALPTSPRGLMQGARHQPPAS